MANRPSDTDVHHRARVEATGRSHRFAAWLLVGWAAFWLSSTAHACCAGFMPKAPSSGEAVFAGLPAGNPNPSDHDDPLPSTCPEIMVPTAAAAYAAPGFTDRSESRAPVFGTSISGIDAAAASLPLKLRFASIPPPHAPLYLRTARLLI